jgi:uncharacterized protein DUF1707
MAAYDLVPAPHDVLASDEERERVVEALRSNAAAGRLDADELEERLGAAYAARIRGDLLPLLADLPSPAPPVARRPRRSIPALPPFVVIGLMLVAIWALSGAGYFWPAWPIAALAFSGLGYRRHGAGGRPTSPPSRSSPAP